MDTKKQTDRLSRIRQNEVASHIEAYTPEKLYALDTWLKKPIKTILLYWQYKTENGGFRP